MITSAPLLVPPAPPLAPPDASGLRVLRGLGRNALAAFPSRCMDEPVTRLRMPALGPALVLASAPEAVRQVLQTDAGSYRRLQAVQRVLRPIVGRGLLVSEGEPWRQQRKAMAPAFTPRAVPVLAGHIAACAEASWGQLEKSGDGPVDLLAAMQRLALDIAALSMFALETAAFGGELRAMVSGYLATGGRPSPSDFLLPPGLPTPRSVSRAVFRWRWSRLMRRIIAARRARDAAGPPAAAARDLFDLMAAAHGHDDETLLADQVATMIVAGHETTALTLFWACFLLAQAPDWQQALADEARLLDLAPDRAAAALPALRQTRAVVQETLRLYPPAFMTARQARVAGRLGGVRVPAGAIVLVPFWVLHRNERWWGPTAGAFDPGRFLARPEPDRFAYLPFGAGPHVCIGAQLALTEAVLVLARAMQGSRLALVADRPVLPVGVLTTRPDHAPLFTIRRR